MLMQLWIATALTSCVLCSAAWADDAPPASAGYKALKHAPPAALAGTWAVLDRDGANRQVEKYLSSLGGGESGTGVVVSPAFKIATDNVSFTICGHDGQQGGQGKNYLALVDARKGLVLHKTAAPGNDALQERSWDTSKLQGREVRIEVHDGDSGGAYAWLGIGRIDAGPELRVDFRQGLPQAWKTESKPIEPRAETVEGGVPFRRYAGEYTMVPASGAAEIACGFKAERLFVLGCVVPEGKPLEEYGQIEIVYRGGPTDTFPLVYGFNLETAGTHLSRSKAMHLHPSGDVFQHYMVLGPRPEVIEKIVLRRHPERALPRITAITGQTAAEGPGLEPLPGGKPGAEESAWIESHTITSKSPDMDQVKAEIRRAHKLPPPDAH